MYKKQRFLCLSQYLKQVQQQQKILNLQLLISIYKQSHSSYQVIFFFKAEK